MRWLGVSDICVVFERFNVDEEMLGTLAVIIWPLYTVAANKTLINSRGFVGQNALD